MNTEKQTTENVLLQIAAPLLDWYRANARALPWRNTNDPYRIWVSEIMLQQTRVAAVLGYYDRFLSVFPSVEALAGAPEARLMKLWEGLGYYSRARNLQRAAQCIVQRGSFPDTYEELLALPGIGAYTAGAIASAAFGRREAAVDGNVLRVVTRITDCHDDVQSTRVRSSIRDLIQAAMPEQDADIRIFNQAWMELGATVCVPAGPPDCDRCPVREFCRGRILGTAGALPVKSAKKPRRIEEKTVFLLLQNGTAALRRRPETGLLAGLWEFPNTEGILDEQQVSATVSAWGLTPKTWHRKLTARHIFSHVEWHMTGYVLEVDGTDTEGFNWVDQAGLHGHAIPSAFARYHAEVKKHVKKRS